MQYMMFYQYYLHIFEAFNSKWRLFSIVKIKSPQSLQDKKKGESPYIIVHLKS